MPPNPAVTTLFRYEKYDHTNDANFKFKTFLQIRHVEPKNSADMQNILLRMLQIESFSHVQLS